MAGRDKASLSELGAGLTKNDIQISWVESGAKGIAMMAEINFDLIVADEVLGDMTGLEFIRGAVSQNPMVNCAAISSLPPEDYHEASEGLGIMMQLPVRPGEEYAAILLDNLKNIWKQYKIDRVQ
jgi:two-component SAPR family response regulator